jgi:hypothetical protein
MARQQYDIWGPVSRYPMGTPRERVAWAAHRAADRVGGRVLAVIDRVTGQHYQPSEDKPPNWRERIAERRHDYPRNAYECEREDWLSQEDRRQQIEAERRRLEDEWDDDGVWDAAEAADQADQQARREDIDHYDRQGDAEDDGEWDPDPWSYPDAARWSPDLEREAG